MKEKREFVMTGVSQITIQKKWIWYCVLAVVLFLIVPGGMFYISATARPPTVHSGGY